MRAVLPCQGPGDKEHVEARSQSVQFKCDGNRVAQLVGDFYKAVTPIKGKVEYDEQEVSGYLEELCDMLIKPIWSAVATGLRSKSTVVFVPDKILNRVPFALLRHRNSKKYLFELYPISVAPSLRVLQHCKRRLTYLESCPLKPGKSVVAIGGASYEETQLLPGSGKEVTELAERFPGLVYKLEKGDATSANLLALLEESAVSKEKHAFGLMHLGVHCHWDDTYKTGAIQFAKPSKSDKISNHGSITGTPNCTFPALEQEAVASTSRDGERLQSAFGEVGVVTRDCSFKSSTSNWGKEMIQSEDIIANGLQWPTSLVVLSACNSSKGEVFGDGEVNLPRALMIAGVPATLVAQWKVVDRASPELMRVFYDSLQSGQDVATALQSSMLHALRVHKSNSASKIHEWGPFVVWGLPSVQLPKELWTEDAKKALAEPYLQDISDSRHLIMSNVLRLQRFLASIDDDCTSENASVIYDAISAALELFHLGLMHAYTFAPIEQAFVPIEQAFVKVPLEHLHKFEVLLEASDPEVLYRFRWCMRYAQGIQGRFQLALDYANALIADQSSEHHLLHRQERAVVLRLLGRHGEALKEFDDLLEPGFDYECQIERSCVKYQMGDKDGALEDARHAQLMWPARPDQFMLVLLSFHAIPPEFREWISKACNTSQLHNCLLVPAPCSSSYISTGDGEGGSGSMDPNLNSELHRALRVSVEEVPALRTEAAMKRSVKDSATKELQTGETSIARDVATSDAGLVEITDMSITDPTIDDDTALLEQALAMSMTGIPSAESGGDDQDLAHAVQMSMQEQC